MSKPSQPQASSAGSIDAASAPPSIKVRSTSATEASQARTSSALAWLRRSSGPGAGRCAARVARLGADAQQRQPVGLDHLGEADAMAEAAHMRGEAVDDRTGAIVRRRRRR